MDTWGDSYHNKSNSHTRLLFENFNGLQLGKHHRHPKINKLREICNNMEVDILGGTETQTNWHLTSHSQRLTTVFKSEAALKAIAVCNSHEKFNFHQEGGTAMLAFDQITSYAKTTDPDPTGLGRWCSILFEGKEGIKTRIIAAYIPGKGSHKRLLSVKAQHRRHLRSLHDYRCPRKAAREDLSTAIDQWISDGERIILFADANESVRRGKLSRMLRRLGLREQLSHRHPHLEEPNTWFRGSQQIDGLWLSPQLQPEILCFLPFGLTVGDHRGILLDIPTHLLVGDEVPTIVRPNARRLQAYNPKVKHSYNEFLESYSVQHRLLEKYYSILTDSSLPKQHIEHYLNRIDTQLGEGMKAAEKRCRKLKMGSVPFSPMVNTLGQTWSVWKLIVRHKKTNRVQRERIKRLARACNISRPLSYSLTEATEHCRVARKIYLENKPSARSIRNSFLSSNSDISLDKREQEAERASSNLIQREKSRSFWRKINAFRAKARSESVVTVKVGINGVVTTEVTKEGVENAIINEVSKRFRLTEKWSAFRADFLSKTLGLVGETEQAQAILDGNFETESELDPFTEKVIQHLARPPSMLRAGQIRTSFTSKDFQRHWKKARESTSSSISGLHFGHYKAASGSQYLSELHSIKVHLSVNHGIPLQRWSRGLQVMLLKIQGVVNVDQLRAILLLEGDYNWLTSELIGKRMISHASSASEIPEEHFGGLKDCTSIDLAVSRCVNWDLLRQRRWAGGVASVDASNCYDRVVHNVAALAARRWGVPKEAMQCILGTLRLMQFYLRTGHGDSTQSYGGSWDDPFQGLCQGNGSAPGSWTSTNSVLVDIQRSEGHAVNFRTAITGVMKLLAALIFVDDTDVIKHTLTASPDATSIIPSLQEAVNLWQGILRSTGGDLKQKKCAVQLVGFKWRDGHPTYRRPHQAPVITILNNDGDRVPIQYHDHDEAVEVVGVWQAPCGSMTTQISKLCEKAEDAVNALAQGGADRSTTAVHFAACLWRSIAYPLPAMNMTFNESLPLEKALYTTTISNLGLTRSFPTVLRFLPYSYYGMQLPRPYPSMNFDKISFWLRHSTATTVPGHILRTSYEELTIEVGCPGGLFLQSFEVYGHLATHCWIKGLWRFLYENHLRLSFPTELLFLQRKNDEFLIPMFHQMGATPEELLRLNRCRLHTHTITLADVVTGDGRRLRKEALCNHNDQWHLDSLFHPWPTTKPQRRDWELWASFLTRRMSPFDSSKPDLTEWYSFSHGKTTWWYSPSTFLLYRKIEEIWTCFSPGRQTPARPGSTFLLHSETAPSTPILRATVQLRPNNIVLFDGAHDSPPPDVLYQTVDSLLIELDDCWLLHHSTFPSNLQIFSTCPIWRLVCDGSYMPMRNRSLGAAAWMLEVLTGSNPCHGATGCPGICSDSYRPELTGLLTGLCAIFHLLRTLKPPQVTIEIACDNDSALSRCEQFMSPLPTSKSNSDLLRAIYRLMQHLKLHYNCLFSFTQVEGHADKNKKWDSLTRLEQMNCLVDHSAKAYLSTMIETNMIPEDSIPFSGWTIGPLDQRLSQGPLTPALLDATSAGAAKEYWVTKKQRISSEGFHLVDWHALGKALHSSNTAFRLWATKHVSGFCATAKRMHMLYPTTWPEDTCPSCTTETESIFHIPKCQCPDIVSVFESKAHSLVRWMYSVGTDPVLLRSLKRYLLAKGTRPFRLPAGEASLRPAGFLTEMNDIGWDNFMMGMIPRQFAIHQESYYCTVGNNRCARTWAADLIYGILSITRACWLKRNRLLYGYSEEFVSDDTYNQLTERIQSEYRRGPENASAEDLYLWEKSLRDLLAMAVPDRQSWLYSVALARQDN